MLPSNLLPGNLLEGRVALVTGGGSGLGRAITEHFVRHGARCAILGRRADVLSDAVREIGADAVLPVVGDVRDLFAVEKAVERVVERFGAVDVLVNNAAANFLSPTEDLTPNAFRLIADVVLMGTVNCTLTIGKRWIAERRPGVVLNVLTTYSSTGSGYVCPSACAKAGVEVLTRSLAGEWGKYGIRFVGIAPGPFPTQGATSRLFMDESFADGAARRNPLRRMGRIDEFGTLAAFLVSDAAAYVNGEIIRIDGGEGVSLAGQFNFLETMPRDAWRTYRKRVRNGAESQCGSGIPENSSGAGRRDGAVTQTAPTEE